MALCSKNIQTKLSQFVYMSLVLKEREETKNQIFRIIEASEIRIHSFRRSL